MQQAKNSKLSCTLGREALGENKAKRTGQAHTADPGLTAASLGLLPRTHKERRRRPQRQINRMLNNKQRGGRLEERLEMKERAIKKIERQQEKAHSATI